MNNRRNFVASILAFPILGFVQPMASNPLSFFEPQLKNNRDCPLLFYVIFENNVLHVNSVKKEELHELMKTLVPDHEKRIGNFPVFKRI